MKNYNNIDDLFRESVAGFKVAPSEDLLKNIEASRLAEKRGGRKAIYLWSLAALLIIFAGVAGWLFFGMQTSREAMPSPQIVREVLPQKQLHKTDEPQKETGEITEQDRLETPNASPVEKTVLPSEELTQDETLFANDATPYLVKEVNSLVTKPEPEITVQQNTTVEELQYRSIYEIAQMSPEPIDPRTVKGMDKYLEKRRNVHFYTGVGVTVAMAYYPSTTDQFTWSTDLALGLKVHNFYFESGVAYQEMQERGIYQIDFKSRDSIGYYNEVISFEIDPQNPDEITYKTQQKTVYDSVGHYIHTTPLFRYTYLNIPLKLGYRFYQKGQFAVSAETGIIFSKMLSKEIPEVSLNNPDYELIAITNQTPGRVDVNYQWHLALRLNYRFAKTISLAVQPVFTKYINSIYDTQAGYPSVKPYTMGLRFGIYFDF